MNWKACLGLVALLLAAQMASAQPFIDDFDDGDDDGWTRYDPLASVGAPPASYTFPNGGYRIQAGSSPDPQRFNVSRASSYRADLQYADFFARVDIVDWNEELPQGFALTARTRDIGLMTSDGYLATVQNNDYLAIARLTDEWATLLAYAPCPIEPGHQYRLRFRGTGDRLVASVYDLADPSIPISTVEAQDSTYASGYVTLISHAIPGDGSGNSPTDVTFDNFVSVPEPGTAALVAAALPLVLRRRLRWATGLPTGSREPTKRIGAASKRHTCRWKALLISTLFAANVCPAQVIYHVNGACGDDAWSGLSATCAAPDGPKATIQAAIDAASDGDTVLVAPGTYVEAYYLNRVLTLQSTGGPEVTTLTPGASGPILNCNVPMTDSPTISGFRFWDGGGACCTYTGGAINVLSGSPIVTDCEFYGNSASRAGGAIYAPDGSLLTLVRCLFVGNSAFSTTDGAFVRGGAVRAGQFIVDSCRFENNRAILFCFPCQGGGTAAGALYGTGIVTNSTFIGNGAGAGAAAYLGAGSSIVNCTIVSNTGWDESIPGSAVFGSGDVSVFNSIVYGNDASYQIYSYTNAVVGYSNVQGGYSGEGNIDADPRFVVHPDPAPNVGGCFFCPIGVGDVRLRGRSPCIDAGDNDALPPDVLDLDGDGDTAEPIPFDLAGRARVVRGLRGSDQAVVDMGAYEWQSWFAAGSPMNP